MITLSYICLVLYLRQKRETPRAAPYKVSVPTWMSPTVGKILKIPLKMHMFIEVFIHQRGGGGGGVTVSENQMGNEET